VLRLLHVALIQGDLRWRLGIRSRSGPDLHIAAIDLSEEPWRRWKTNCAVKFCETGWKAEPQIARLVSRIFTAFAIISYQPDSISSD
jgi:hypothetical protein